MTESNINWKSFYLKDTSIELTLAKFTSRTQAGYVLLLLPVQVALQ